MFKVTLFTSGELVFQTETSASIVVRNPTIESPQQYAQFLSSLMVGGACSLNFGDVEFSTVGGVITVLITTLIGSKITLRYPSYQFKEAFAEALDLR